MPTTLTVQSGSRTASVSLDDVATAADGTGNNWANTGTEFLYVNNASGGSITVTQVFASGATIDGQAGTNRTTTVAAGKRVLVGPFPVQYYSDPTTGHMSVTYSAVASVTVAVVKLT